MELFLLDILRKTIITLYTTITCAWKFAPDVILSIRSRMNVKSPCRYVTTITIDFKPNLDDFTETMIAYTLSVNGLNIRPIVSGSVAVFASKQVGNINILALGSPRTSSSSVCHFNFRV